MRGKGRRSLRRPSSPHLSDKLAKRPLFPLPSPRKRPPRFIPRSPHNRRRVLRLTRDENGAGEDRREEGDHRGVFGGAANEDDASREEGGGVGVKTDVG